MNTSETIAELAKALAAAQGEYPQIKKSKTATVRPKDGSTPFSYNYADLGTYLPSVENILSKHGLALSQSPETKIEGTAAVRLSLVTRLMHASGEWLETVFELPVFSLGKMNALQSICSMITYCRRYAIDAILGLASEDDRDGQGESGDGNGKGHEQDAGGGSEEHPPLVQQIKDILECGLFTKEQKDGALQKLKQIKPDDVESLMYFRGLWQRQKEQAEEAARKNRNPQPPAGATAGIPASQPKGAK